MNVKFNDNFFLKVHTTDVPQSEIKTKETPTNFIFVIDVSGSMSYDLELIRKQLKNKLPNLIKEKDTVTIIWFSGKNQAGILKEEVEIRSLLSLQDLNNAIDRYLKPICLTAFHEPLVLAKEAIGRISKNRPNTAFSLIFLTDGYNNDCAWKDVIQSLKDLSNDLSASTFVEYGYYADSKKIAEMAEIVGGEKVSAEHFDDYDLVFEAKLLKSYGTSKKKTIELPTKVFFDFVFSLNDETKEIIVYGVDGKNVTVPEDCNTVLYFTNEGSYTSGQQPTMEEVTRYMYASLYVLSDKLKYDEAEQVFGILKDKRLYDLYSNAYGKQKLLGFKNAIKECIMDESKWFVGGKLDKLVVDENAYCVMNLIDDLTNTENVLLYPHHSEFNYKRIGAKRVSSTELNESVKTEITNATTAEEVVEILKKLDGDKVKFEYNDKSKGYPISNLVWSTERANLSINVKFDGYVKLPSNNFSLDKVDTFQFRNYNIIKDGILNLSKLPLSLPKELYDKFSKIDGLIVSMGFQNDVMIYVLDLSVLPIINKKMVKSISAKKLGEMEYEVVKLKAKEKAYKFYEGLHFPKVSKGFVDKYGIDAEAWLKTLGITEYNGFSPSGKTEKGSDFYMGVQLDTKIANHSTIPKVIDVINKITTNKNLKPVESLMKPVIDEYISETNSKMYLALKDENLKNQILENWLTNARKDMNKAKRTLMQEIAQIKFSLILSKKWFEEFSSFEENTLTLNIDGNDVNFKFEMYEKEISL